MKQLLMIGKAYVQIYPLMNEVREFVGSLHNLEVGSDRLVHDGAWWFHRVVNVNGDTPLNQLAEVKKDWKKIELDNGIYRIIFDPDIPISFRIKEN